MTHGRKGRRAPNALVGQTLTPALPSRQRGFCAGLLTAAAECGDACAVTLLAARDAAEVNRANEVRARRDAHARASCWHRCFTNLSLH